MSNKLAHKIAVSVVYATEAKQWLHEAVVPRGTSAQELVALSGFTEMIPALLTADIEQLDLGIYAQRIKPDYLLQDGDRLEIYRPLRADPKEVRRQLAKMGKTMGKGGG